MKMWAQLISSDVDLLVRFPLCLHWSQSKLVSFFYAMMCYVWKWVVILKFKLVCLLISAWCVRVLYVKLPPLSEFFLFCNIVFD